MPVADLGSVRMHYEIEGAGPALVLLAGMVSYGASWGPVVPALAEVFTVIRPDNRSTGRTLPRDARAGLAEWAGDVAALLGRLGIGRAHVAGHSLGGIIGLHLAATEPARVRRLALVASGPVFPPRNVALFRHLLALRGPGMAGDLWLRGFFPWLFHPRVFADPAAIETMVALSLGYVHAQGAEAMAAQVAALEAAEAVLALPARLPPTVAIIARDDLMMPPDMLRPALARLGAVRTVEIADAGHSVHWDAPRPVAAALIEHFGEE